MTVIDAIAKEFHLNPVEYFLFHFTGQENMI